MFEEANGPSGVTPEDRAAMQEMLTRYSTGIDFKQWDLFKRCWTEDADLTYGELEQGAGDLSYRGADDITTGVARIHSRITGSLHRLTNFDVLEYDGRRATSRTYGNTVLVAKGAEGGDVFHITGYYHDELLRTDQGWQIKSRYWGTIWRDGNSGVLAVD